MVRSGEERWGAVGSGGERRGAVGSGGERWGAVGSGGERWSRGKAPDCQSTGRWFNPTCHRFET